MSEDKLQATVRRASPLVNIIDIRGEISSLSEKALIDAYTLASAGNIRTVIFNFTEMNYMNSFGIGMLITLLIRASREGKKITGYGLSEHYLHIFDLTRLDQAIPIYATQEIALARAEPFDLPERES
ncbi:MAG TPA: STAS domain-containing protein [Anaerolineales bacterium]